MSGWCFFNCSAAWKIIATLFPIDTLFMATISSNNTLTYLSDGDVIPWGETPFDPGNNFDLSLHAYVAPVDGYYQ